MCERLCKETPTAGATNVDESASDIRSVSRSIERTRARAAKRVTAVLIILIFYTDRCIQLMQPGGALHVLLFTARQTSLASSAKA